MKAILLVLALSATSVLSSPLPLPATRRASGVVIKYTADYPPQHPPSPPVARTDVNSAPEDDPDAGLDELPSATGGGSDLDNILSIERPLPSAFLMAVPALRAERSEAESKQLRQQQQLQQQQQGEQSRSRDNVARNSWSAGASAVAGAGARHACPLAALAAFSILSLLVLAIQRWRKPRGEIYLHIDPAAQVSLSVRDGGEEGGASDEKTAHA